MSNVATAPHPVQTCDEPPASLVRRELEQICQRWKEADDRAHRLRTYGDIGGAEDAEEARRELQGAFWAIEQALIDLGVLLWRHMLKREPGILRSCFRPLLLDLLSEELPDALDLLLKTRRGKRHD